MRWIDTIEELEAAAADLAQGSDYFIDTEFESTRSRTRLSVIQVSRGDELYLIDALRLDNLRELGTVLCRPGGQWVLHAGLTDVRLLLEAFERTQPPRLFDTQLAWALAGPEASVSLAYLKFKLLGQRSMKTHQTDDWMRRPLPLSQMEYAASDISELPKLYEQLAQRLDELGRRQLMDEVCRELLLPQSDPPPKLDLSSFRNAWQLAPKNQAALVFLMEWHNALPERERSRAPVNKTLLAIASRLPKTPKDLLRIKGVPPHYGGKTAADLVRGLNTAVKKASAGDFEQLEPPPYATFEEVLLDAWLTSLRAEVCAEVLIAPDLAFPARQLRALKQLALESKNPGVVLQSLAGWRAEVLTRPTEHFMRKHPPPLGTAT